jgi:flagellar secretion chaperone FliS
MKTAHYQAYSVASQTMPKTRQIVMLYEGAIRNMQQAKEAITEKRIEDRYNLLIKASEIVIALQSCLDFEAGGDVAQVLYDYYSSIDARIMTIHRSNSLEMCDRVIAELKEMRDAWQEVDRTHSTTTVETASGGDAEAPVNGTTPATLQVSA